MPLVINNLGGGHTHTHTSQTKAISRNQLYAGPPGLIMTIIIIIIKEK